MSEKKDNDIDIESIDGIQENESKNNPIIIIPAYNPDDKLIKTVNQIIKAGFKEIIIIDDGSDLDTQNIFTTLYEECDIHLIRHAVNQGKGRALKTAFNYALYHYPDHSVITCDGDGQHSIKAIINTKKAINQYPDELVFGCRKFSLGKNMPVSNFLGNKITIFVFYLLTGMLFKDTQTGLRGFPPSAMKLFLHTKGERFEFENIMLLDVRRHQIAYIELPIEAIYINDNETSHFNKFEDSFRIYSNILSFAAIPAIAGLLGFLFFYIFMTNCIICSPLRPTLIYAASNLLSWLLLSFFTKSNKFRDTLLVIGVVLLFSVLFYFINLAVPSYNGSWWLTAIIAAPVSFIIYRIQRFGKKPKRTKYQP